jgi:hypothetical protein
VYHRVSHKFSEFFHHIETSSGGRALCIYRQCFECMLHQRRTDRPSAKKVLATMAKRRFFSPVQECENKCGNAEIEDSDGDSDWDYLEAPSS